MKLKTVTITGADDWTSHQYLINLSKRFPFVEWGILFSPTRNKESQPRYPSFDWVKKLGAGQQIKSSHHLCGFYTKEILENGVVTSSINLQRELLNVIPDRYQLNFTTSSSNEICDKFYKTIQEISTFNYIILQYNDNNKEVCDKIIAESSKNRSHIHFLHDCSAGNGILPTEWPAPIPYHFTGYAGGLDPENLESELAKIAQHQNVNVPIWIDVESGVRTNNEFDLKKVVKFLEIAEKYT